MIRVPNRVSDRLRRLWERETFRRVVWMSVPTFLVGYVVTALLFFASGPRADVITVPDVRSMTVNSARRELSRFDLTILVSDSLPNARTPRGAVLAQTPLPGQEVPPETQVSVILSEGRERRAVPRIDRYPRSQAERILTASGFRVVVQSLPDLRSRGSIVGTVPSAGTMVAMPASIRLLISAGPPMVAIPSVIGMSVDQARVSLESLGLRIRVSPQLRPDLAEGIVLAQRPAPGDTIAAGRSIELSVSTLLLPPPDTMPTTEPEPPEETPAPAATPGTQ